MTHYYMIRLRVYPNIIGVSKLESARPRARAPLRRGACRGGVNKFVTCIKEEYW